MPQIFIKLFSSFLAALFTRSLALFAPEKESVRRWREASAEDLYRTLPHVEAFRAVALSQKNLHALFLYRDPRTKEIVWEIKYRKNRALAEKVGELLYREMKKVFDQLDLNSAEKIILTPVPTSRGRKRNRGFSQCEVLCEAIMKCDKDRKTFLYKPKLLEKIKETPRQEGLARAERLKNVVGSFAVAESERENVRGKIVFVVDDVITTGTTIGEMQRVLCEAEAKKVCGFAIGH